MKKHTKENIYLFIHLLVFYLRPMNANQASGISVFGARGKHGF